MKEERKINEQDIRDIKYYIKSKGVIGEIGMIIVLFVVIQVLLYFIDRGLNKWKETDRIRNLKSFARIDTLTGTFAKVLKVIFYFIGVVIALNILGFNTKNLFATLGIGSIVIGIGAQSFIKDVIGGFLIIIEDQFSVGDFVRIGSVEGVVKEMGIRTTKLENYKGEIHIIPNGTITTLTNRSRKAQRTAVEVFVSYEEDPDKIMGFIKDVLKGYYERPEFLSSEIWGVTKFERLGYVITFVFFANWGDNFDLEYEIREAIIKKLKEEEVKTFLVLKEKPCYITSKEI